MTPVHAAGPYAAERDDSHARASTLAPVARRRDDRLRAVRAVAAITLASGATDAGESDPLSVTLLLLETLPLIVRRRWPIPVLVVTLAATVAPRLLAEGQVVNESLGALVALFTVAERYDRRVVGRGRRSPSAARSSAVIFSKGGSQAAIAGTDPPTMLAVVVVLALGDWARTRRRYAAAIEENARLQEAEREERSRRAVQDERERIARELHDIVTHHVSVIVIQAGAGLTALDRRPERARTALEAIDRTSREALTDMRRMLGILGDRATRHRPASDDPRSRCPAWSASASSSRRSAPPASRSSCRWTARRRPLDAGIELSAYRIVQEALTNALKHARGARARVRLAYEPRAIDIEVTDQGGTGERDLGEAGGGGRGLIGMRERVALYGGDFEAGPTPTGFRVHARLPVDAEPAAGAMTAAIRVILVDDQELVRTGFRMILEDQPDIEVVGEAADGKAGVEVAERLQPDVVVMDIRMPVLDGIAATRRIVRDGAAPNARVLILTTFDADENVVEALRAGASGFLLKDVTPAGFVVAIKTIADGDALLAPAVTRRLLDRYADRLPPVNDERNAALRDLTEREVEVLKLVGRGLSNREIAERLVLAEPTVKTHISHVFDKLELRDRAQAVVLAYEAGLIRPGSIDDRDDARPIPRDELTAPEPTPAAPGVRDPGPTTPEPARPNLMSPRTPVSHDTGDTTDDQRLGHLDGRTHQALSQAWRP